MGGRCVYVTGRHWLRVVHSRQDTNCCHCAGILLLAIAAGVADMLMSLGVGGTLTRARAVATTGAITDFESQQSVRAAVLYAADLSI